VRGAGEKAFCAGGDVRSIRENYLAGNTLNAAFFAFEYAFDHYVYSYPKPYIACMHGIVMGGGMGIAQGSRLRIVSDHTRMAMPETAIGLFPDVGASYFLSRLPGGLGNYLGVCGTHLRAADALYTGLADLYVPAAKLEAIDAVLHDWQSTRANSTDLQQALQSLGITTLPDAPLAALRPAIDLHFAQPSVPLIMQSLRAEARDEFRTWAEQTLDTMSKRSPLAMCVTLEQLHRGKTLKLADCFRMELNLIMRTLEHGDFMEGVRALLEKNSARWQHARAEDVSPQDVAAAFAPLWNQYSHPLTSLK
jgi:enoyl-CoA hydratase/carnithine racemase